jgi:hypothetical protein
MDAALPTLPERKSNLTVSLAFRLLLTSYIVTCRKMGPAEEGERFREGPDTKNLRPYLRPDSWGLTVVYEQEGDLVAGEGTWEPD